MPILAKKAMNISFLEFHIVSSWLDVFTGTARRNRRDPVDSRLEGFISKHFQEPALAEEAPA